MSRQVVLMSPIRKADCTKFSMNLPHWRESELNSFVIQFPNLIHDIRSSTSVALKAREVLILGQMPSYEERLVQMESVLKNSVSNTYYGESGGSTKYDL